ncbi:uncharacterized protein SCHCODRAFT_01168033 [Schizophyllum commune H4-8]|uniref:Expressed protein n=1 Tax=Schizophyllum commune (strain H4-8 / FGSC 9210) TaxID=578458 RepID=D8PVG5_SCHCM|nr:uncharacterized protein SCHCODRAFT_01168033 [Schizophyllum commune H4-8]KAI5900363.1 hypothetical protein SCHCODRAFT_01168033 [Schizophyllum commune H4-8]
MAAKKDAIAAAKLAIETCSATQLALKKDDLSSTHTLDAPLATIHNDLRSILSMLHHSTTKLALAMSQQEHSATLSPLKDITVQIPTLLHCVSLFDANVVGRTLAQEVRIVATDVTVSTAALLHSFVKGEGPASAGSDSKEYLFRTGSVHEIIDAARGVQGISVDNIAAVKKKWVGNQAPLEDGIKELAESIEDAKSGPAEEKDDEDDFDDGWDELGISSNDKMSPEELARAEKGHILLRMCSMLHKRVAKDLLKTSHPPSVDNALLDSLPGLSAYLLSSADDFIMSLEAPQDISQVTECLDGLVEQIHDLQTTLAPFFPDAPPSPNTPPSSESKPDNEAPKESKPTPSKWFDTCFGQIDKGAAALRALLPQDN